VTLSRNISPIVLTVCLVSAVACANASTPPYTHATATRPFVARGFKFGCPNLFQPPPDGVLQEVGIAFRRAVNVCESNLGGLTIYRNAAKAKQACAPSAYYFCGPSQYRVRNLILAIDPRDSLTTRSRLLKALRTLGPPVRIA
jgi:hypothetical protein